jgi:hypothetical protein
MTLFFGDEQTISYIKFNAKERLWAINDDQGEVLKIDPPRMLIDIEHVQTGWFRFREGQAPDILLDVKDVPAPEPEGENHKRGFRVFVFSTDLGLREFTSSSLMLKQAMKALYAAWEKEKGQHPNQVPLVEVVEHEPVTGRYGTNYRPVFRIVSWHERPEALAAKVPQNGSTTPQVPVAPAAPQMATTPTVAPSVDVELDDSIPF